MQRPSEIPIRRIDPNTSAEAPAAEQLPILPERGIILDIGIAGEEIAASSAEEVAPVVEASTAIENDPHATPEEQAASARIQEEAQRAQHTLLQRIHAAQESVRYSRSASPYEQALQRDAAAQQVYDEAVVPTSTNEEATAESATPTEAEKKPVLILLAEASRLADEMDALLDQYKKARNGSKKEAAIKASLQEKRQALAKLRQKDSEDYMGDAALNVYYIRRALKEAEEKLAQTKKAVIDNTGEFKEKAVQKLEEKLTEAEAQLRANPERAPRGTVLSIEGAISAEQERITSDPQYLHALDQLDRIAHHDTTGATADDLMTALDDIDDDSIQAAARKEAAGLATGMDSMDLTNQLIESAKNTQERQEIITEAAIKSAEQKKFTEAAEFAFLITDPSAKDKTYAALAKISSRIDPTSAQIFCKEIRNINVREYTQVSIALLGNDIDAAIAHAEKIQENFLQQRAAQLIREKMKRINVQQMYCHLETELVQ